MSKLFKILQTVTIISFTSIFFVTICSEQLIIKLKICELLEWLIQFQKGVLIPENYRIFLLFLPLVFNCFIFLLCWEQERSQKGKD